MKSFLSLSLVTLSGVLLSTAAIAADEPAKHQCQQPPVPGHFASDNTLKVINKKTEIYKQCIEKFADEQRQISKKATEIPKANAAHDAAEAAMKELNEYIKKRNDEGGE